MLYNQITTQIKQAGAMILSAADENVHVYNKNGISNFVTEYDKKVQQFLVAQMKNLIPDAKFLAEEDGQQGSLGDGYCFIIDPIDGTTNFIFDYKNSCISIGLALRGEIVFGAVYNPYTDEMYTAEKGMGAQLNGEAITCSSNGLAENLAAFGCARYNEGDTDNIFAFAKQLYLNSLGVRNGGSAAIDLCRIASGSNGLYVELLLQPWDYSAASLIISEAGGKITQVDGNNITIDKPCSILAGSSLCWDEGFRLWQETI